MKKILGLSIAALLVIGLVAGGTWAYFSDTEASTGNTFTAGTLNLKLTDSNETDQDGVTASFSGTNLAPGSVVGPSTITLKNTGTLTADHVDIKFGVAYTNVVLPAELGTDATAANWLEVTGLSYASADLLAISAGAFTNAAIEAADNAGNNDQKITLNELNDVIVQALAAPAADSGTENFIITVTIPTSTGNGPQGDTVTVTVTFGLYQDPGDHLS
jgi:spore coat-associated protein N